MNGRVTIGSPGIGGALHFSGSTGNINWPYASDTGSRSWALVGEQGVFGILNLQVSSTQTGAVDTNIMIWNKSGKVGIGSDTTPDYGLDVIADINSDDCFREAGTQVAGTCASDIRLKQNIAPLTGSLNKILQLKPVEFEWKPGIEELGGTIRYVEGRLA